MDPTKEQHQMLRRSWKNAMETPEMVRKVFKEEIISRIQVFEWRAWFRADRKM
jgi:hypothetical protein